MLVYVGMWTEHVGAPGGWKRASDPWGLSYLTWMLGTELRSSERSASILISL